MYLCRSLLYGSRFPAIEAETPLAIDDEVDRNTSVDCNESVNFLSDTHGQGLLSTSNNISEIMGPYRRSRAQQWMSDYPIDIRIDNTIELSIRDRDADWGGWTQQYDLRYAVSPIRCDVRWAGETMNFATNSSCGG